MDPLTWTAIAVLVSTGAGFGAGWGLKPDSAVKALQAQTAAMETLNAGNQALVEQVTAASLLESEKDLLIADKLTGIPPQCVPELNGDVNSPACMLAWCIRTGETDKQRCEPAKLMDLYIRQVQAREVSCPD